MVKWRSYLVSPSERRRRRAAREADTVRDLYALLLGRTPDDGEIAIHRPAGGRLDPIGLVRGIVESAEFGRRALALPAVAASVERDLVARAQGPGDVLAARLRSGAALPDALAAAHLRVGRIADVVGAAFRQLLGREPDAADAFVEAIADGALGEEALLAELVASPEFAARLAKSPEVIATVTASLAPNGIGDARDAVRDALAGGVSPWQAIEAAGLMLAHLDTTWSGDPTRDILIDAEDFVEDLFERFLGRGAGTDAPAFVAALIRQATTPARMAAELAAGPESLERIAQDPHVAGTVLRAMLDALGWDAAECEAVLSDGAEMIGAVAARIRDRENTLREAAIAASEPPADRSEAIRSDVRAIFDVLLRREIDAGALRAYSNEVISGNMSLADFVGQLVGSREFATAAYRQELIAADLAGRIVRSLVPSDSEGAPGETAAVTRAIAEGTPLEDVVARVQAFAATEAGRGAHPPQIYPGEIGQLAQDLIVDCLVGMGGKVALAGMSQLSEQPTSPEQIARALHTLAALADARGDGGLPYRRPAASPAAAARRG